MKFKKDNKDINFLYSKDLKYCSLAIGKEIKDKYSEEEHPIEKAIREAEKFVYIISPYLNEEAIKNNLIKKLNNNEKIDIKLICSYKSTDKKNIDNNYLKIFKNFILEQDFSELKELKNKWILDMAFYSKKYENFKKEILKRKDKNKKFTKILYSLLYLLPICLVVYGYFRKLDKSILISSGLFFISLIIFMIMLKKQKKRIIKEESKLEYEKKFFEEDKESELAKIRVIPPYKSNFFIKINSMFTTLKFFYFSQIIA